MALPPNWQAAILRGIGAPVTPQNLQFLNEWHAREGGGDKNSANFNPLNTTQGAPGARGMNSVGVKAYVSPTQGIRATVQTLLNGHYGDIVSGLRSNVGATRLAASRSLDTWGTGRWSGSKPPVAGGRVSPGLQLASRLRTNGAAPAVSQGNYRALVAQWLLQQSAEEAAGHVNAGDLTGLALARGQMSVGQGQAPAGAAGPVRTTAPAAPAAMGHGGTVNFDGKPVAAWIGGILNQARAAGWRGTVNSGYRSVAEQARIYNSGVRPAARPGQSNHNFTAFPGGAVDVTDAPQLAAILKRLGVTKLQWAGGKDPVHFSHPHNGGY